MRKEILFIALIAVLILATACTQTQTTPAIQGYAVQEETSSKLVPDDEVIHYIDDLDIDGCQIKLKEINKGNGMTDQEARDNCISIAALIKEDKSICNKVSEGFRSTCLGVFD